MVNGWLVKDMEKEFCCGRMEVDMKDNGEITVLRAKGSCLTVNMKVIKAVG